MNLSNIETVYWPLTRRGLFSEILVFSYVKTCCGYHNIDVHPLLPIDLSIYWSRVFSSRSFHFTLLPSNLLNPVSPPHSLVNLLDRFIPQLANISARNQIFKVLWSKKAELFYANTSNFSQNLLQNLATFFPCQKHSYHPNSNLYNAIHLRRGDKVYNPNPEAKLSKTDKYISLAKEVFDNNLPIHIFSDSYMHANNLKNNLLSEGFSNVFLKCPYQYITSKGYDQSNFNKLHLREKTKYTLSFLDDFNRMISSNFLICTYSSCVGRAAHIMRRGSNIVSVDTSFSVVQ